jgi:hypothetical protein
MARHAGPNDSAHTPLQAEPKMPPALHTCSFVILTRAIRNAHTAKLHAGSSIEMFSLGRTMDDEFAHRAAPHRMGRAACTAAG